MKRVVGIWDISRARGVLGTLLILLEELQIQRVVHCADSVEVLVVGDVVDIVRGAGPRRMRSGPPDSTLKSVSTLLCSMGGIDSYTICADAAAYAEAASRLTGDAIIWPDPDSLIRGAYEYDTTTRVQAHFADRGTIPRLSVNNDFLHWARGYLREGTVAGLSVALHLKNNPHAPGNSNANPEAWAAFIETTARSCDAHFYLIGDESTNEEYAAFPNVTVAHADGAGLGGYLALIQVSDLFMGMMSGPSNMALFGSKPYVIFKNPDHHAREMTVELGDADRYAFALDNQRVVRAWDTVEVITAVFEQATRLLVSA